MPHARRLSDLTDTLADINVHATDPHTRAPTSHCAQAQPSQGSSCPGRCDYHCHSPSPLTQHAEESDVFGEDQKEEEETPQIVDQERLVVALELEAGAGHGDIVGKMLSVSF